MNLLFYGLLELKKFFLINLLLFISVIIFVFYLFLSSVVTPFALNKSRQLLSNDNLNSFYLLLKLINLVTLLKDLLLVDKKSRIKLRISFYMTKGKFKKFIIKYFRNKRNYNNCRNWNCRRKKYDAF